MSIVSSYISSRAPVFRINVQASTLMDHILAIVAGLGVRIVFDVVGYEDHRLSGSLVGLWEGVVVQHFIKKSPKSFDPYVAYGVRVFIDFLFTESLVRLVLTFLFTGMGIVFADIAPRIWVDTGLRRFWRHLRRDLYTVLHSVPSIPDFTRPRTVRFSPSRAPSVITSAPPSPSVVTIATQAPITPLPRKRPVPGSFPDYVSETDTDLSVRSPGLGYSTLTGQIRDRRPTVQTESETSYDPDEGNRSSSGSGTPTPILSEADLPNLPNIEDEDLAREVVLEDHKDENTPRPPPIKLPPTPSDTTYAVHLNPDEIPPPSAGLPQIPDDEDWENISRREAQATPGLDNSINALPVEPTFSTSPADNKQVPASSTPLTAEVQPEVIELDPYAEQLHTLADEARATTSSTTIAPPATNNESAFDFLDEFNASNPVAQTSYSPPSYAPFDFSGSGVPATSLWGTSPLAAKSGGNVDLWGDVKSRQGAAEAGSNAFDAGIGTVDLFEKRQEQDDAQHAESTTEESGEQQDSNTTPEGGLSSPAPEIEVPLTEDPSTDIFASRSDDVGSESATQQEKQNLLSSTPQLEAGTSQPAKETDPAVNEPKGAKPSNTQQDVDPAGEEATSEQPPTTQEANDMNKITAAGGETIRNIDLTTPVDDDESLPDGDEGLKRVFALRQEIVKVNEDTEKLRQNLRMLGGPSIKEQIIKNETMLVELDKKAKRWYNDVCSIDAASEEVDLSNVNAIEFHAKVTKIVILGLLKSLPSIKFKTGNPLKKNGKARKALLIKWLDGLDLQDRTYGDANVNTDNIVVKLPTMTL